MKVGIAITFGAGFSGGRLHAFLVGAEMAAQGHEVTFICNQPPGFLDKLPAVPGKDQVKFEKLKFDLLRPPVGRRFDLWMVVQERSLNGRFYAPVFEHARRHGTPLLLLAFETPNWQEALLGPFKHGVADALMNETMRLGAQCLSLTQVGREWARRYFSATPPEDFHFLNPLVLASCYTEPVPRDDRLIVAFTRRSSGHKGQDTIFRLLNRRLRGWRVVLIDGLGASFELENYVRLKREVDGLDVELRSNITEAEKYRLLKSARVLLYPSTFEGFGLPPGEALYWGTPVICFELPVLRETYGDDLRYVPAADNVAFEAALHDELARTPTYAPAASARQVGDMERWRREIEALVATVVRRAHAPLALPQANTVHDFDVVIVDQIGDWNREDTALAAGVAPDACQSVRFNREIFGQRKSDRAMRPLLPNDTFLPLGNSDEDLRAKLLVALESTTSPLVFLTEDLLVCPAEVVQSACERLVTSGAQGAAIPVRWHFQGDDERHYRTRDGQLLAACGVFQREFLLHCLRSTTIAGCRAQPVIDLSYLVLAKGGVIVPATEGHADRLPPRTAPVESDMLPGGAGTWHADFRSQRGLLEALDPLPCRYPDNEEELAALTMIRRQMFAVIRDNFEGRLVKSRLREMTDALMQHSPAWRAMFDLRQPYRAKHQITDSYLLYGRAFLTSRHLALFLDSALAALADAMPVPAHQVVYRGIHDSLIALRERSEVVE